MTPDEMNMPIEDVSYGVPSGLPSSSARMIGFAKLSPTIVSEVTRWRSTVASSSWGIEAAALERHHVSAGQVRDEPPEPTTGPVHQWCRRDRHQCAAVLGRTGDHGGDLAGVARRCEAEDREAEFHEAAGQSAHVVHHALWHAGRAAGVQHVEVVFGPFDPIHRVGCRHDVVVGECVRHLAGVTVVDLDQQRELRQTFGHPCHPLAE
jgi:hypothetical protein